MWQSAGGSLRLQTFNFDREPGALSDIVSRARSFPHPIQLWVQRRVRHQPRERLLPETVHADRGMGHGDLLLQRHLLVLCPYTWTFYWWRLRGSKLHSSGVWNCLPRCKSKFRTGFKTLNFRLKSCERKRWETLVTEVTESKEWNECTESQDSLVTHFSLWYLYTNIRIFNFHLEFY